MNSILFGGCMVFCAFLVTVALVVLISGALLLMLEIGHEIALKVGKHD